MVVPSLLSYIGSLLENQNGLVDVDYMQGGILLEQDSLSLSMTDGDIVLQSLLSV